MRALELKDIAGYLPYGLVVKCKVSNDHALYWACACHILFEKVLLSGARDKEWHTLDKIKPYLRPMSDLTKEITHKGETFVPLDRIQAISRFFEFDDCGLLFMRNGCTQSEWLQVFELLSEWKFDYHGLIPASLAIDVNTLPENPYEK